MQTNHIKIDTKDNIIVATTNLYKGDILTVDGIDVTLKGNIKIKHKFALNDFEIGDSIFMYGVLVGLATKKIFQGEAITTENIEHASASYEGKNDQHNWQAPDISGFKGRTFNGYHRDNGSVGTKNYWLVLPLTFCENRNLDVIESALSESLGYKTIKDFAIDIRPLIDMQKSGASVNELMDANISSTHEEVAKNRLFPNLDGIRFLRHEGGCGGSPSDSETLVNLLAGYISSPNVAGATVLSLGCQHAQIDMLDDALKKINPNFSKPIYFLEQQKSKNERSFIEDCVKQTFAGLVEANKVVRSPAPLSKLVMGLECGGSDGFSGISANPALGNASDLLVALGGTPVLSEFPELNGVEQEIINRCETEASAKKFINLMHLYNESAKAVGSGFENNPSPGNVKDGLITDAIKSAGAAKKAGSSHVMDVLDYTEIITKNGLNLLCTPGNDVESTTGLAGSGCNIIVFTTGLGTPTGNPISPVLKLSSNNSLFEKMNDIIDINAGTVISGEDTIESMGEKILEHVISVASGEIESKADMHGHNDFIPWKRGVSL